MNRYVWFALRGVTWLVVALGLALYCLLLFIWAIEWRQNSYIHASRSAEADFIFFDAILGSGLPPLLIALYFFGRCNRPHEWAAGLGFFMLFFFWQYVSYAFLAHAPWYTYQPMLLAGTAAALFVVWLWEAKRAGVAADRQ
jgi:hypothetical protein